MRRLLLHALVLAAIALAVGWASNASDAAAVDDEALYGMQAHALIEGRWHYEYSGASFDERGEWLPLGRMDRIGDRWYPYVRHPAYPLLLSAVMRVTGDGFGLFLLPVAGLVGAAAAAWFVAAELRDGAGPIAFWLIGASPVMVNSSLLWAHAPSAAVAGVTTLLAVRMLTRGASPARLGAFAVSLALGIALRSEALLFAAAVTTAVAGALLWRFRVARREWADEVGSLPAKRRRAGDLPTRPGRALALPALVVVAVGFGSALATVMVEQRVVQGLVGTAEPADPTNRLELTGSLSEVAARRAATAWKTLLSPSQTRPGASYPVVAAMAVITGAALFARRIARSPNATAILVGLAAAVCALYAIRLAQFETEWARGLLAAWPAVLAGLAATSWRATSEAERAVVGATALFAGAVLVFQYDAGAAVEWGGRYLTPLVPGLAALVAVGVSRRLASLPRVRPSTRWAASAFAVIVLAVPLAPGFAKLREARDENHRLVQLVDAAATDTVVIYTPVPRFYTLPAIAWRLSDDRQFLRATPRTGVRLMEEMYEAGLDEVTLFHAAGDPILDSLPYERLVDVTPPELRANRGAAHVLHR